MLNSTTLHKVLLLGAGTGGVTGRLPTGLRARGWRKAFHPAPAMP